MSKKGFKFTKKQREKLALAALGRKHSKATKEKISLKLKGICPSSKTKLLMKNREFLKRKLFKTLLDHLSKSHPNFNRKECKGYYKWVKCPICEKSII